MSSDPIPTLAGKNAQRSINNAADLDDVAARQEEIDSRLDRLEKYMIAAVSTLSVMGAKALGIPTDALFKLLLSLL